MLKQKYKKIKSPVSNHYIDNQKFKDEVDKSIANNRQATELLGLYFIKIADKILSSRRYSGYSNDWKEEMKSFAILKCVKAVNTVDPSKAKDVFNYFTRVTYNAFYAILYKLTKQQQMIKDLQNNAQMLTNKAQNSRTFDK